MFWKTPTAGEVVRPLQGVSSQLISFAHLSSFERVQHELTVKQRRAQEKLAGTIGRAAITVDRWQLNTLHCSVGILSINLEVDE
jgi:hypothetical protein